MKILNKFSYIFESIKKNFYKILLAFVLIINSGVCYIGFAASSKTKIIILIFSLIVLLIGFLGSLDFKFVLGNLREKKIKPLLISFRNFLLRIDTISLIIVFFITTINIVLNYKNPPINVTTNLNTILGTLSSFSMAFLLAQFVDFNTFLKVVSKSIFILSIVSITLYLTIFISKTYFNSNSFWSSARSYDSYFFIFYSYTGSLLDSTLQRMMGIFWEPGLYANFLLISLMAELFYLDKTSWIRVVVYVVALFLTKSTAGYLILAILLIAYGMKYLKGRKLTVITLIVILLSVILFFYFDKICLFLGSIVPSVFGKLANQTGSFITRFEGPLYFLKIFFSSPLLGKGFDVSMNLYKHNTANTLIDSATSTFAHLLASVGVFGIVIAIFVMIGFYKFGSNKLNSSVRLLLTLCIFLISNTEVQTQILIILTLYFISIKELSNYRINCYMLDSSNNNSIAYSLFHSNSLFEKNIFGSVVLKFLALLVGFFNIPIFNSFFGIDSIYGAWLSIVSILVTILSLDFGITDGLKNKLIESRKNKDNLNTRKLISSSYFLLFIVGISFSLLFSILSFTIDWNNFLNIPENLVSKETVTISMIIIAFTIGCEVFLRNIVSILSSHEHIVLANSMSLITNFSLLIICLMFKDLNCNKILLLAFSYFFCVNAPLFVVSVFCFKKYLPYAVPSLKFVEKTKFKEISNVGFKFLAIQICNLVLWGIDKVLISNLFGVENVVYYEKYFKIFSTIVSLFTIIQPTLWIYISKYNKEGNKKKRNKLIKLSFGASLLLATGSILAGLLCQWLFDIWLKEQSFSVLISDLAPFVVYGVMCSIFAVICLLCYSLDVLRNLSIAAIGISVIKVPLLYTLCKFNNNLSWSIVMWVNVLLLIPYILLPTFELLQHKRRVNESL